MFTSIIPQNVDWKEINSFFESNSFCGELLSPEWRNSDLFHTALLSDKSMQVLECLHEDLYQCYRTVFVRDRNGNEDRREEYKLLRELLFSKYSNISEITLQQIYSAYLVSDR